MTPTQTDLVLKFLIDRLEPDAQDELKTLLGGDLPTIAEDVLRTGRIALDSLPARMKEKLIRGMVKNGKPQTMDEILKADPDYGKTLEERFPGIDRLGR